MTMPELSIVIAVLNEEKRLPRTLHRLLEYLTRAGLRFEIIIVNDGSIDGTVGKVLDFSRETGGVVKLLSHFPNFGRGISIREGVLSARGEIILETDADCSVDPEAILRFLAEFKKRPDLDVIFGSRQMAGATVTNKPTIRVFLGYGFIYLAKIMLWSWRTTDFTLGFKMFRKKSAQDIFAHQYDNHFAAEAEIVYVAKVRGWRIAELPVTWTDNRDSRVRPLRDSFRSFRGILKILLNRLAGKY